MRLPAYSKYKSSSVEWLGRVPEDWEIKKLRYLALLKSGENITSEQLEDEGTFPVYGGNGLRGYSTRFTHDGDHVLIGRQGALCGNINYAKGKFWASEHAVVVQPLAKFATFWMGELLRAMNLNQYSVSAAQPGLAVDTISALKIPVPPSVEQCALADFLERETARLDTLVGKKRELIEKLKEKRTALISRTVSRGLPPGAARAAGLNPHPKLKPSGIDWLGDIPEHWENSRVGYGATKIGSGKTPRGGSETYQSEGVMLIRSQNVYDEGLRLDDVVYIDEETDEEMAATRVRPNDVLLNITGASLGRCAIVPASVSRGNVNQHVCIVRPNTKNVNPSFLRRALTSQTTKSQIFADEAGSSREGLNFQQVRDLRIAVPSINEQRIIADYLDRETAKLDRMMEKVEAAIEKLQEYRTALITAAVTGKIDVRKGPKSAVST